MIFSLTYPFKIIFIYTISLLINIRLIHILYLSVKVIGSQNVNVHGRVYVQPGGQMPLTIFFKIPCSYI
jgi:hypothetical protein